MVRISTGGLQFLSHFDAGHGRHLDIGNDHVDVSGKIINGGAVGALGDDVDLTVALQHGGKAGADDGVIVDKHDADH